MRIMLRRPRGLLLDFGGVIVDAPSLPPSPADLVDRVHRLVDGAISVDQIARDLVQGAHAYGVWRDETSAEARPVELSHEQVWGDFVASGWPEPARQAVRDEATALSYAWNWRPEWALRPGIPEALGAAAAADLPVAVVSNALCGAAHRDFLAGTGLTDAFVVELYSDEVGIRKPNPEMAWRAARALAVPIEECWFVGDSVHRDIACARRAGAGAAILMRSPRTDRERELAGITPDVVVDDGHGLRSLLGQSIPT